MHNKKFKYLIEQIGTLRRLSEPFLGCSDFLAAFFRLSASFQAGFSASIVGFFVSLAAYRDCNKSKKSKR